MIPARTYPAIRYPSEQFQQVTARIRYRDRHDRLCRSGRGSTNGKLTMTKLRWPGSVRGPCSYRSFVTFPRPARRS